MKLATNWKTIAPATALAALLVWGIAGQNRIEGAGSLTPPPGTPTPTMPTLQQIGDKVDTLASGGRNFALREATRVQVWDSRTGNFGPLQTVTGLTQVIESDGNFCARGNQGGAAWNKETRTWVVVSSIQGAVSMSRSALPSRRSCTMRPPSLWMPRRAMSMASIWPGGNFLTASK